MNKQIKFEISIKLQNQLKAVTKVSQETGILEYLGSISIKYRKVK